MTKAWKAAVVIEYVLILVSLGINWYMYSGLKKANRHGAALTAYLNDETEVPMKFRAWVLHTNKDVHLVYKAAQDHGWIPASENHEVPPPPPNWCPPVCN